MEDNFDKKIFYYCKVRCSFIVGNLALWVREKQAKNCTLKAPAMVLIDQFEFRLQAEGVVGIDKACHFASSCHA